MRQPGALLALLVKRTCGVDKVVADDLSRMFEDESSENPEIICSTMLGLVAFDIFVFPRVSGNDAFCNDLRGKVEIEEASAKFLHAQRRTVLFPQEGEEAPMGCATILEGHVIAVLSRRHF